MGVGDNSIQARQRWISTLGFSLFGGWLLAFPFQGQVLAALVENTSVDMAYLNLTSVIAHFIGLITSGFFIKRQYAAKMTMVIATVVCLAGTLIFFLPASILWYLALPAMAFFAGLVVASWGYYYQKYSPPHRRLRTAADFLIISNILMILTNVLAVNISPFLGLGLLIIFLLGALLLTFRMEACPQPDYHMSAEKGLNQPKQSLIVKPLVFLCFFILIITVDSGLMYQVVTPAFSQFEHLASYYWAVPYIAALVVLRMLSPEINKTYILYVAMIMIGLSYLAFMWLKTSLTSYLLINTLMLGAFGVCDLFWWSILGNFFEYWDNPAQILGIGLAMNVLGVIIGGVIGNQLNMIPNGMVYTAILALVVLFAVMLLLPILNNLLAQLLKSHPFLIRLGGMEEKEQEQALVTFKNKQQLTEKETEVVQMLLKGYTYKAISEKLFISENTLKYHVKNIYQKLNINSKMELIKLFSQQK